MYTLSTGDDYLILQWTISVEGTVSLKWTKLFFILYQLFTVMKTIPTLETGPDYIRIEESDDRLNIQKCFSMIDIFLKPNRSSHNHLL